MDENIESSYKKTFELFQQKLLKTSLSVSIVCLIVEILFFPLCYFGGMITIEIPLYILFFIIKPSLINFLAYFVGKYIYEKKDLSENGKTMLPLIIFIIFCCNVVRIHSIFPVLYAVFVIPVFVSVIYGEERIEKNTTIICLIGMTITFIISYFEKITGTTANYGFNVMLSFCLMIFAHIIAKALIKYEKRKESILEKNVNYNVFLEYQTLHDGLTKLHNHNALFNHWDSIDKESTPICLSILDIDFFKKVNDTYGHEKGNIVLCKLAEHLLKIENDDIFVARYGGEEFVILFKNHELNDAFNIINDLKIKMQNEKFKELKNKSITFSAGIALYNKKMRLTDFINKADEALYEAKESGRNKIVIAKDSI